MEIEIEKIARKQVEETLESIKRILGIYLYGSIVLDGLKYLVENARLGYLGLENDMWDEDGENLEKLVEFLCGCILERVM